MNKRTQFTLLLIFVLALAACGGSTPAVQVTSNAVELPEPAVTEQAPVLSENADGLPGEESPVQAEAPVLAQDFENAVNIQLQLLVGTLQLEGTPLAVTADQAAELLTLWQVIKSLTGSGTSAEAEINALLSQIQETMSIEQIQAIRDMQITNTDYQAKMAELGFTVGMNSEGGGGQPGQGANLSADEKATRQAARLAAGGTGTGGKNALVDRLIEVLQSKQ